jgi:hypothetical protein
MTPLVYLSDFIALCKEMHVCLAIGHTPLTPWLRHP